MSLSLVTVPVTFKAVGCAAVGAPFEPVTRTVNVLQPDEVLVKVSYASINPMDVKIHQSNFAQLPMPMVLGYDFAGTIVAMGIAIGMYPGETEALTLAASVTGSTFGMGEGGGCFGEYVVAKRNRVTLCGEIPELEAATYGIAFQSAWESLFITADIRARGGQTIFIPGGAGGVGHFAVQLAKAYGLRVIATASKPEGLELLQRLLVDVVIDYKKQDVVVEVLNATGGRGVDVAYDATYMESSMIQAAAVLAKGGQWVRLGTFTHDPPARQQTLEQIVGTRDGRAVVSDLSRYSYQDEYKGKVNLLADGMRMARQLYAERRVRPFISGTVPLDASAIQQALLDSQKGTVGKVVVKVQQE